MSEKMDLFETNSNIRIEFEELVSHARSISNLRGKISEHFIKAFDNVRFQLKDDKILRGKELKAITKYTNFSSIRFRQFRDNIATYNPNSGEIKVIEWLLSSGNDIRDFPENLRIDYEKESYYEKMENEEL